MWEKKRKESDPHYFYHCRSMYVDPCFMKGSLDDCWGFKLCLMHLFQLALLLFNRNISFVEELQWFTGVIVQSEH